MRVGFFEAVMLLLSFAFIFFIVSTAFCDARPVPAQELTPAARLDLARSCAGEAGLRSGLTGECIAIAWVYARRYEQTRARYPEMTFHDVVRAYSSALKPPTQTWVPGLRADAKEPTGWPTRLSWKRHAPLWMGILVSIDRWAAGEESDPCPGARHFGGAMDIVPAHWRVIECRSPVLNRFYAVR